MGKSHIFRVGGVIFIGLKGLHLSGWCVITQEFCKARGGRPQKKGQFILIGSANPEERARLHSGAGRFSVIKMRTMSLFEKGWSTGEVSLEKIMRGGAPQSGQADFSLENLAEKMGPPAALTIITANGLACRRKDGVNVVPLSVLTAYPCRYFSKKTANLRIASVRVSLSGRNTMRKWSGSFQLKPVPLTKSRCCSRNRSSMNFSSFVMLKRFTSTFGKQ